MSFDPMCYKAYESVILEQMNALLAIDSPSGYGREVTEHLLRTLRALDIPAELTVKGGVIATIPGKRTGDAVLMQAHCDTLGAMIHEIKSDGRLRLTPIGGMSPNNGEGENVRVHTRGGSCYEGTLQLINASCHVNKEYGTTTRTWDTVEVVLDEPVHSAEDVRRLGMRNGDYVCFEPRTRVTGSGYIKSRFLDDKLSAAILLAYATYLKREGITLDRTLYLHFTIYEEVGHGGANPCYADITEVWSVDMGCVGEGLQCTEREVSIAAKDSGGPYHYDTVTRLIELAERHGIPHAVDIYPYYGSDVEATLAAGADIKHVLIGPGVYASHGYERSHIDGATGTFRLIQAYLEA